MQNVESIDDNISEQSKMFVGFEINNKIVHVNIKTPLPIINKEDYESKYGDKLNVCPYEKLMLVFCFVCFVFF